MRLHLIAKAKNFSGHFELSITISHCAADGRSMFTVAHDLLSELSSSSSCSSSLAHLPQQPLYDSIGSLPQAEILRLGPAEIPYDTRKVLPQPKYQVEEIENGKWQNLVECHQFTEQETEQILSIVREKKISLQVSTKKEEKEKKRIFSSLILLLLFFRLY